MSHSRLIEAAKRNKNGGYYHQGDSCTYEKKLEIVKLYFRHWEVTFPTRPTLTSVAKDCRVSRNTVRKYIDEFETHRRSLDPKEAEVVKKALGKVGRNVKPLLTLKEEQYIVALRADDPSRPLANYVEELRDEFNKVVSISYTNSWFKKRFFIRATLTMSSLVPKDKFKSNNWLSYYEFCMNVSYLSDQTKFNLIDEKHLVNKQGYQIRVRKDPLTGDIDGVLADGDFQDSYSILCCISGNPDKEENITFTIGQETNNAESFVAFVEQMIADGFLHHGEVLVMDNAPIHHGGVASILEDLLWTTIVDSHPLNVLVLFLPTRSPELNPIELIFNVLASQLKLFHYRHPGPIQEKVLDRCKRVLQEIEYNTIV